MNTALRITICPTCGSNKIERVRRDWAGKFHDQTYTVPLLEFYECPGCGERIYDRQAMKRIEAHSPAFSGARAKRGVHPATRARQSASRQSA